MEIAETADAAAADHHEGAEVRREIEEIEERTEEAATTITEAFGDRRISIHRMTSPLRRATAFAMGLVVLTMIVMAIRGLGSGSVDLGSFNGAVDYMNAPILGVVLMLLAVGFGYVFTAASLTSWWIALPVTGGLLTLIGLYTGAFQGVVNFFPFEVRAWAAWTGRAMLAAIFAVVVSDKVIDWRSGRRLRDRNLRVGLLAIHVALAAGYLVVLWVGSRDQGGISLFGREVALVFGSVIILANPILLTTSVDFAEWGHILAQRVGTVPALKRVLPVWWVAAVAASGCCVLGTVQLHAHAAGWANVAGQGLRSASLLAGIALVTGGLLLVVGLHRRLDEPKVNFAALVVVLAVLYLALPPIDLALSGGFSHALTTRSLSFGPNADVVLVRAGSGSEAYSLQLPFGWQTQPDSQCPSSTVHSCLIAQSPDGTVNLNLYITSQANVQGQFTDTFDGWRWTQGTDDGAMSVYWVTPVIGANPPEYYFMWDQVLPARTPPSVLFAIAHSFRGSGAAPAPLPHLSQTDKTITLEGALGLGLAALGLVWVAARRRWWPVPAIAGLIVMAILSLFTLLGDLDSIGSYLFRASNWPTLRSAGMIAGTGLLGLVILIVLRASRRQDTKTGRTIVAGVLGMEGAVAALKLLFYLYGRALSAEQIAIWAGIILVVGAAWDFTMSGESLTNLDTPRLPRGSRVLGWCGYLLVMASTVLFYSVERVGVHGPFLNGQFEPEALVQEYMFYTALPVLMFILIWRAMRSVHQSRQVAATSAPDSTRAAPVRP